MRRHGLGEDEVANSGEGLLGLVPKYPVTGASKDLQPRFRNRRGHVLLIRDRSDRIEFSCKDQCRAADAAEITEPVISKPFASEEVKAHLRTEANASEHVRVQRRWVIERQAGHHEGLEVLLVRVAEEGLGDGPRFLAAEALEHRQSSVEPEARNAARYDELERQISVADGHAERDDAAE